ncbi:hypothetical protein HanXRQr2_Chr10g0421121 [Helianthus annuus]|uniref:Secreted protein n=1 Tax=Helianthus annuus TaxID=4232 RepID=A0A9K3HUW2_HELAN|nr:hypothetical protein HanXRQr2_Chr10g0421121 [Helianthus annuus]
MCPYFCITFFVASAAASLARRVPLAIMAANSFPISSCTLFLASPRGSTTGFSCDVPAGTTAGGTTSSVFDFASPLVALAFALLPDDVSTFFDT